MARRHPNTYDDSRLFDVEADRDHPHTTVPEPPGRATGPASSRPAPAVPTNEQAISREEVGSDTYWDIAQAYGTRGDAPADRSRTTPAASPSLREMS